MKKYKVTGTITVVVNKEVWAMSEDDALDKARVQLDSLTEYCGNGGSDKLVGVEKEGESVEVYDNIDYESVELLEDDPDYFECPMCGAECEACLSKDYDEYYHCPECDMCYDKDGDEIDIDDEEEEE